MCVRNLSIPISFLVISKVGDANQNFLNHHGVSASVISPNKPSAALAISEQEIALSY